MTREAALGLGLPLLLCLLAALAVWAMTVGASDLAFGQVARALWAPGGERADLVVRGVRLPRVLAAIAVGRHWRSQARSCRR